MTEHVHNVVETVKAAPGVVGDFVGGVWVWLATGLGVVTVAVVLSVVVIKVRPRRRIGYVMVPDPKFDPSAEEIVRWAAGLGEARSAVGFGAESHKMVRLSYCSDPEGNLVSVVGMNPRARSVAERNGYAGIALSDPCELLGDLAPAWLPTSPDPSAALDRGGVLDRGEDAGLVVPVAGDDLAVSPLVPDGDEFEVVGGRRRWEDVL